MEWKGRGDTHGRICQTDMSARQMLDENLIVCGTIGHVGLTNFRCWMELNSVQLSADKLDHFLSFLISNQ